MPKPQTVRHLPVMTDARTGRPPQLAAPLPSTAPSMVIFLYALVTAPAQAQENSASAQQRDPCARLGDNHQVAGRFTELISGTVGGCLPEVRADVGEGYDTK